MDEKLQNGIIDTEEIELAKRDYSDELLEIISTLSAEQLVEALDEYHENDIAAVLEKLTAEQRKHLYKALGNERMSEIFAYLEDVSEYVEEIGADAAADIIENMDADDAVDVLDELDEETRQEVIDLLEPEAAADIDLIYSYDDDEFGSIMSTNFIAINKNLSIAAAMKSLIADAAENDNISTIYALDDDGAFYGAIDLKDLIIARKNTSLESLIITSYPFVYDREIISDTIPRLKEYSEDSIPVISYEDKKVLGVITSQALVEVVDEELGDDYAKLAGLSAEEDLKEPVFKSVQKRIPWLVVLLILSLLISGVIGAFEGIFKQISIIVCFQSLILGMAGNTGTQSLAVTIRVLTDEELTFKQRVSLVFKEMRIALLGGIVLGGVSFLLVGGYIHFLKGEAWAFSLMVALCVAASLCISMLIAGLSGSLIPLIFKRIGVDPAVASGPLITTINDLVAVITYYGLSWLLLSSIIGL